MEFTLEQFKEWVDENFADNNERAIAESNFRDGLSAMADFVFQTNSTAFVQGSIQAMNLIKADAAASATQAESKRAATALLLSQTQIVTGLAEQYKNDTLAIKQNADASAVLARVFQDSWNMVTNVPNLGALTLNNTTDKGKYWKVSPGGAATTTITGVSVTASESDEFTWNGTKWIWTSAVVSDRSITKLKLANDVALSIPNLVDVVNGKYPILMTPSNRMLIWHLLSGVICGKFDLSLSDIPYDRLPDAVKNGVTTVEDVTTTDVFPILMTPAKRMLIYGRKDGSILIPKFQTPAKSIGEAQLTDSVAAKLLTESFKATSETSFYDVEIVDDELLRGVEIEIPIKTSALVGYPFQQFPNVKTKILKGLNDTGTDLLFRQSGGLVIRGRQYKGDFNPTTSGFVGTSFKGTYGNSYTATWGAFPAGAIGDCWVIDNGNVSTSRTANGLTFKNGDMLVVTSGGYGIQPGPGDGTYSSKQGDFWNITTAGYFGGIYYPANSRIYQLGQQSNSGPKYIKYAVSKPGELYTMGECDAAFAPGSQRDGDLYIFSAAATTQGLTGSIGDFLIYRGGWGIFSGHAVSVPNSKSFFLACSNANEWSVRRADKSAVEVSVKAYGHRTTVRRKNKFDLALFSDSMFGVGVGAKILTLTGRTGTTKSYGGATSYEVLSMVKDYILTNDLYAGSVFGFWHGQNNTADLVQIKDAAHRMAALVGSYEARFAFWSVLGARTVSWNGTRFVAAVQEDAFNGTGFVLEVEKFYESAFPRQYYSPRKALLETAALRTAVPDLLYPGQTEAQTAATYGILPFSYWFEFSGKPFTAANVVFVGYQSAAGLPAGGVDLDYYIRTGGGVVGNIIVKVAGVWTEYTWDSIHLSGEGSDAAASKFKQYLTLHNI